MEEAFSLQKESPLQEQPPGHPRNTTPSSSVPVTSTPNTQGRSRHGLQRPELQGPAVRLAFVGSPVVAAASEQV